MAFVFFQLNHQRFLGVFKFRQIGNHRKHHVQFLARRRKQKGADLFAQDRPPVKRDPDRTPADRRVGFSGIGPVGQKLVRPHVQTAENHFFVAAAVHQVLIIRHLFFDVGHGVGSHKGNLRTVKAHPVAVGGFDIVKIHRQPDIDVKPDIDPVQRLCRQTAESRQFFLQFFPFGDSLAEVGLDLGRRIDINKTFVAVKRHRLPALNFGKNSLDLRQHRNV